MIIAGIDTETTGLDVTAGHRIIEIAIIRYDFDTKQKISEYVQRIDPKRPIDAKAQAVHHISEAELVGMPTWDQVAARVKQELESSDMLVAHNMGFDAPFIVCELQRVGQDLTRADLFCTMEGARWATFDGKLPKLQELCNALGVPYDPAKAHAAQYDVERMMDCFFRGVARGRYNVAPIEA